MTRAQALEAFFAAVDLYMPHDALDGRAAIRQAGIAYASAAATEAIENTLRLYVPPPDDRHLLDGVAPSPAPQTEGLRQDASRPRLVSDLTDTFDHEYDGEKQ